jgi:hypothetical protein
MHQFTLFLQQIDSDLGNMNKMLLLLGFDANNKKNISYATPNV